ncbi:MAG: VanW family protein, partial [bacterium]
YNAALLAGLDVLERSNHSLYDPSEAYVPPGRDAMVTRSGHHDFCFRNSTAEDLTLSVQASGGSLTVALWGRQRHPHRRWIETRVVRRLPAHVVARVVPGLAPGRRVLVRPGFDGMVVADSLCWSQRGLTRCAALGVDHYARVDALWHVGPASVTDSVSSR